MNTRNFSRYDTMNLKANYSLEEKEGWEACTINKVSRKGLGITFHTDEEITVGTTLHFKIFVSQELEYFTVNGIVRWIEKEENNLVGGVELSNFLSENEWIQLVFYIPTPCEKTHRQYMS